MTDRPTEVRSNPAPLPTRQRVAGLAALGLGARPIARALGASREAVRAHLAAIKGKRRRRARGARRG